MSYCFPESLDSASFDFKVLRAIPRLSSRQIHPRRPPVAVRNSEEDAYKIIRDQAMSKRVTAEEIADAVINANEILGFDLKS